MSDNSIPQPDAAARPKGPANTMPGGTAHTAGGERADADGPSYIDAVRSLGPEYYLNFYKRPCVRDSQLVGIGAGFVGGSIAAITRRGTVRTCSNVAVLAWAGFSCASYQYCQYYRSKEKAGIKQAQELMERKRLKIEAKKEQRRKEREQREREEERQRLEDARKRSWGYWIDKNVRFW